MLCHTPSERLEVWYSVTSVTIYENLMWPHHVFFLKIIFTCTYKLQRKCTTNNYATNLELPRLCERFFAEVNRFFFTLVDMFSLDFIDIPTSAPGQFPSRQLLPDNSPWTIPPPDNCPIVGIVQGGCWTDFIIANEMYLLISAHILQSFVVVQIFFFLYLLTLYSVSNWVLACISSSSSFLFYKNVSNFCGPPCIPHGKSIALTYNYSWH